MGLNGSVAWLMAFAGGAGFALLALAARAWWQHRHQVAAAPEPHRGASHRRLELLARHANDMLLLADPALLLVEVNERACELTGYGREELLTMAVGDLLDPSASGEAVSWSRPPVDRDGAVFETRFRRKDGAPIPVEVSLRAAQLDGVRSLLVVARDTGERARLEREARLGCRMDSISALSSGLAREINDPLSYILGNVDYALARIDRLPEELEEVRRALQDARGGATRVGEIVRDLRTFSRSAETERGLIDVRRALRMAVALAQAEIRLKAQLSLELGPVPAVIGNEHRLGQAFLHLLVNAAQAIPPGLPTQHLVQASTRVADDGRVAIEIIDSGQGISAEVRAHIFEPFFEARPDGSGRGLGLAIVHGIVTSFGGEVKVQSEPGAGSIFTILLPPATAAAAVAAPGQAAPAPVAALGNATVLTIDDDPMVRRAVARTLSPPHDVVMAETAAEARALLATRSVDLVLCDLRMPGESGMAFYERLLTESPEQARRLIFLTGGAFSDEAREFLARVPNRRLEKPFEPEVLRAMVIDLLGVGR
jgi:PAS domain S-box-containing protein